MDLPTRGGHHGVLAQPTRARLFSLLHELKRPASTNELADHLGLHPNGVRAHLERLHEENLVLRTPTPRPRGRPRDEWSIAPDVRVEGEPPSAYGELARWLARAIPARQSRLRDVEAAGREIGRELAPKEAASPAPALRSALAALGFQPELEVGEGTLVCTLQNCPYRDAVRDNQQVVCTLHRGITRGLLDVLDPESKLTSFVPRDPDAAGCLIEVRGLSGSDPPAAAADENG
ncbi:MAG: helix-turn-helix domain-containing protein [Thermoleophilaceae bacterium]